MKESDLNKLFIYLYRESTKSLEDINEMSGMSPQQTDLYRTKLTAIYGLLSEEKTRIDQRRPDKWTELKHFDEDGNKRSKPLSIKATDMEYDKTEDGQRRIELKNKLDAIEKMCHALAARMRRLNTEAHNEY